nr:sugar phosphate isomerase/epimerase [Myxococcota bacterium]
ERIDPEIFAEVDIYWAQVGGAVPSALLSRLGERARLLHVKDGPADAPESDMTAVGAGSVAIAETLGAAPAAEWHIVELDRCATDLFEAVEASHAFLVGQGLSEGRS